MKRMVVLAAVAAAAIGSANCSNSRDGASSASIMAPSAIDSSGVVSTMARGGGGGGKKPGGGGTTGGTGTLSMVFVNDVNGNGLPNWGDTITWNVQTTSTDTPTVSVQCSQNGVAVYGTSAGFYASYPWPWTVNMTLSSTAWSGGAADCTATLSSVGGSPVLATVRFTAGA